MTLPIPCLHRIHLGAPTGAQAIHESIGMSIERQSLIRRLERLDQDADQAGYSPRSVFVTFDDGWQDVATLVPQFAQLTHLQPILFLTSSQLSGKRELLPLPRLYNWCATNSLKLNDLAAMGLNRSHLKRLPEQTQHLELDRLGVPRVQSPHDILSQTQAKDLMSAGWLIGSHGHEHFDLRQASPKALQQGLTDALNIVVAFGGVPWLAWPEGRCSMQTCDAAALAGFELQFSLRVEAGSIHRSDLLHREIWK